MVLKGSYCLCIEIKKNITIEVGSLGEIVFNHGYYIYIGSALNSMKPRINRHIDMSKGIYNALHWHIDYLLKEREVKISSVFYRESEDKEECIIAEKVAKKGVPIIDFGSSDCDCLSHLYIVKKCDFLSSLGLEKFCVNV